MRHLYSSRTHLYNFSLAFVLKLAQTEERLPSKVVVEVYPNSSLAKLAGAFITTGGVDKHFIDFANACVGHVEINKIM